MNNLSRAETAFVGGLIKKDKRFHGNPPAIAKTFPFALSAMGLLIIGYAVTLFLANPSDHAAKWVLIPGALAGLMLVLSGLLCSILIRRRNEKRRLTGILQKLLL